MKKIILLIISIIMFISIVGCSKNENESLPRKTDHSSETVENLYTSSPSEYQPDIPPQPLAFISIDKAKDFILNPKSSDVNFIKLENKHYEMIDKFKDKGYIPYIKFSKTEELIRFSIIPEAQYEDIGAHYSYKLGNTVLSVALYFIKDDFKAQSKLGIDEYRSARYNATPNDTPKITIEFENQNREVSLIKNGDNSEKILMRWIYDDDIYVTIRSDAPEADIIDFIEHMSIEKLSLTA